MAVTFRNTRHGGLVSCPSPDEGPPRLAQSRAAKIARLDASDEWQREPGPKATKPAPEPERPTKTRKVADDRPPAQPAA